MKASRHPPSPFRALATSPYQDIVTARCRLWDIASRSMISVYTGLEDCVRYVAIAASGRHGLATTGREVVLRDLREPEHRDQYCFRVRSGPSGVAASAACDEFVAANGATLEHYSGLRFDYFGSYCRSEFEGHVKDIVSVALSPDGRVAASVAPFEDTLRLWDLTARGRVPSALGIAAARGECSYEVTRPMAGPFRSGGL